MKTALYIMFVLLLAMPGMAMVTEVYPDGRAATIVTGMQKAYGDMPLCTIYDHEYYYGDGTPYHYIAQGLLTKSSWDGRDICFLSVRRGGGEEKKTVDDTPSDPPACEETCNEECTEEETCAPPVCEWNLRCQWNGHYMQCRWVRDCEEPVCTTENVCTETCSNTCD